MANVKSMGKVVISTNLKKTKVVLDRFGNEVEIKEGMTKKEALNILKSKN